jgi:hypothetical protein
MESSWIFTQESLILLLWFRSEQPLKVHVLNKGCSLEWLYWEVGKTLRGRHSGWFYVIGGVPRKEIVRHGSLPLSFTFWS